MKNFFYEFLTEVLAFLTVASGLIMVSSGIAIVLGRPNLGMIFLGSAITFAFLLWLTVRRKGGWSNFLLVFPW
jgi:hypothetical protein